MAWRSNKDEGRPTRGEAIENIIASSCVIHGDLAAAGGFRIDGTVEGAVHSQAAVIIGESGAVRGEVRGSDIVVAGRVEGNVSCSGHLEILAKGRIEGDVQAQSIRIETGGVFRGTSHMGMRAPAEPEAAAPEQQPPTDLALGALNPESWAT